MVKEIRDHLIKTANILSGWIDHMLGTKYRAAKITIGIFASVVLLVFMFVTIAFLGLTSTSRYHIKELSVTQEETALHLTWKEDKADGYEVFLLHKKDRPKRFKAKKDDCRIDLADLGTEYRVIVLAKSSRGGLSSAVSQKIKTKKLTQKIEPDKNEYIGIEKKTGKITVKAHGKASFASLNPVVATVSKDGTINYKKSGKTAINIKVPEGPQYKAARKKVWLTVYPNQLKQPEIRVNYVSDQKADITWEPVKYAMKYELEKYNPVEDKYEFIEEFNPDATKTSHIRNQTKFKVRAKATIEGTVIESEPSKEAEVRSVSADAETYNSAHNIKTLDLSNLEVVAKISGRGKANVPQSMSHVDDTYVVTFVDKSGKKGVLVTYDKNGKCLGEQSITGMGHANGSTFNPNTGKIYTVKTHKAFWSPSCTTYDLTNDCKKEDFNLPKNTSGIAYDESLNKYFLSKGNELYITNTDFEIEKSMRKFIRYNHAQDIGAYNGIFLVCTWVNGNESYIDMYRASDGEYLGSYNVPIGEIESCFVEVDHEKNEKHLIILMNNGKKVGDSILRTVDPVAIP